MRGPGEKADTIEALAQQINVDPTALKGAVERFNGFVATGWDEDSHRGARVYDRWLGSPLDPNAETLGNIAAALPGDVGTYP